MSSEWNAHRSEILDELCRLEGRGEHSETSLCAGECRGSTDVSYRCSDCYDMQLYCLHCMVRSHRTMPLHRVQVGPAVYWCNSA
jgi:hypothetical protein